MAFTIAHITDPHLSPAPLPGFADFRLKRFMGYVNWKRGRERLNDMAMLERLVEDLRAQRPDHVAVTGDLVNIGMPDEFRRAAAWMRTLGDPLDVSFVPGNHDAYVRASMAALNATFEPWTTSDSGMSGFPYLRVRGEIAIIGLTSGVPTGPLMATGRLGRKQLAAFAALLDEDRRPGSRPRRPHPSPAARARARRHFAASPTPAAFERVIASAAPRLSSTAILTNSSSAPCPQPPRAPSAEGFLCSAPPRPPPQPTTPTAAPRIISSGSTAKPASGASAPGSADWRSAGSISASARRWRCEDDSASDWVEALEGSTPRPQDTKSCRSLARRTARTRPRKQAILPVTPC